MTEPRPPIDDEIVSAVLDGEATAEERALVEGSAEGRRRLEELRAVAARVAAPVAPLSPAAIDRLVAGALDAEGTDVRAPAPAPVAGIAGARERRDRRWGRAVAAAAAAVLVLGGVVAALRVGSGSSSSDSASSSADTVASSAADSGAEAATAAPSSPLGTEPLDVGPRADPAAALDAVEKELAAARTAGNALHKREQMFDNDTRAGGSLCPLPANAAPGSGSWQVIAVTHLPDGPATVLTDTSVTGSSRLVVVDDRTCAVVLERGP